MRQPTVLVCEFVKSIPNELEEGTLYVSMEYATVAHKCCCGCGKEVVTPLSSTDWKLTYDGESISLSPSIGNWSFECRSHYWIEKSTIRWAGQWSKEQIGAGRAHDRRAKERHYTDAELTPQGARSPDRDSSGILGFLVAAPRGRRRNWLYVLAGYIGIAWAYGGIYAWDRWPGPVMDAFIEGIFWPYQLWVMIFLGTPP